MKGYYSLGLSGYEVDIIDQDHVRWLFVGTDREQIAHRAKVYYTAAADLTSMPTAGASTWINA